MRRWKNSGKTIHGDNIRIKGADQIIQRRQRRDLTAGCHIDIHPMNMSDKISLYGFNNLTKSLSFNIYDVCYAKTQREQKDYIFRIGMHRNMTFVKMCHRL